MKKLLIATALTMCAAGAYASNFRGADQVYIPTAGRIVQTTGAANTFISDVQLANLTADTVVISVIYQPINADTDPNNPSSIGQEFKQDKYFHGRPSATTAPDPADSTKTVPAPYNAANSGGSNLGPTSKALNDRIKEDIDRLKVENPAAGIPIDLVTSSGSGLDPDISPEAALFQVPRVAMARNMPEDRVRQLVAQNTSGRLAGLLGEPRVNVLALNLALDAAAGR